MANRLVLLLLVVLLGACGKQIGDACNFPQDCSPNNDRSCDPDPTSPGGYCTILGCDYSTCPGEAACIQFFTGNFSNRPCANDEVNNPEHLCTLDGLPPTEANQLIGKGIESLDEVCALSGFCVSRSSEVRYCMLKCDSDGDCRDGYECRDTDLMIEHGGQPVLAPGQTDVNALKFCAAKPPAST